MSNLSDLLPSGGGQNIVDFTASGTIASGKPVVLNANGTVSQIASTAEAVGTETEFYSSRVDFTNAVYDVNANKIVIFFNRDGYGPYGVVVTVSGSSLSFGTPVQIASGNYYNSLGAIYDSTNNKVLFGYRSSGSGNYKGVVGTVSGTSISFGTPVSANDGNNEKGGKMAYDANAQRVVVTFPDANNSQYGAAVVGTVSGTSISFGTPVVFNSGTTDTGANMAVVYDPSSQKVLIGYREGTPRGYGIVGTVSGTSISFGTGVKFSGSVTPTGITLGYSTSASRILIVYEDENTGNGHAITASISGTTPSYGSDLTWVSAGLAGFENATIALVEDTNANVMTAGFNNNSYNGQVVNFTISGDTVTASSITTWDSGTQNFNIGGAYHTVEKKTVFSWAQTYSTGEAITYSPAFTNLTATNFIGLADAAISDTATGKINVKGSINSKQSSLTIGSDYYAQSDGTVSTTSTSPAVKIGQAVTATTINMMDLT